MKTDKHQLEKINDIWTGVWANTPETLDFCDPLVIFKFKYFLKPVLDQLPRNANVLEIGAGNFQWLLLIRAFRPDLQLHGLDCCDASKDYANRYGFRFIEADARSIGLEDNSFDFVFSWGVIEHLHETEMMLKEHFRLSKKYVAYDVPYKYSIPIIRLSRINRRNGVSKEEEMYRDGKFYSRNEFFMMLQNVLQEQRLQNSEICIMNNYRVLPSFLSRFEILVPTWLRKRIGHNVGALVSF